MYEHFGPIHGYMDNMSPNSNPLHLDYLHNTQGLGSASFLLALGGILLLLLGVILALHIFSATVYMFLGKKAGVKNSWVAYLPYGYSIIGVQMKKWFWAVGLIPMTLFFLDSPGLVFLLCYAWYIFIDYTVLESFGENPNFAFFHLLPGVGSFIVLIKLAAMAFGKTEMPKSIIIENPEVIKHPFNETKDVEK